MHKSIQHPQKPPGHPEYVISTTEICNSIHPSKFLVGLSTKLVGKKCLGKGKNMECLDYVEF